MTLDQFKLTLETGEAPRLRMELLALWHDARGEWRTAHEIVQDDDSAEAAWIHAYLHRKEGDISNARYWYAQAHRPFPGENLDDEWEQIVSHFLSR